MRHPNPTNASTLPHKAHQREPCASPFQMSAALVEHQVLSSLQQNHRWPTSPAPKRTATNSSREDHSYNSTKRMPPAPSPRPQRCRQLPTAPEPTPKQHEQPAPMAHRRRQPPTSPEQPLNRQSCEGNARTLLSKMRGSCDHIHRPTSRPIQSCDASNRNHASGGNNEPRPPAHQLPTHSSAHASQHQPPPHKPPPRQ